MRWRLFSFLTIASFTLSAQFQAVIFNADFAFSEGIYFSHESWIANKPDINWEEVAGEMVQLPEDYRVQIEGMRFKSGQPIDTVYAISLDGFPYIFSRENKVQAFHEFVGLRFRGRYAHYRIEEKREVTKTMYAYNPANGRPFRQAPVTREQIQIKNMLLDVKTGARIGLDKSNVYKLLADHPDLRTAVSRLSEDDQDLNNKLLRAVKIYNEREPLLLQLAE